jgi:hypothetical protein
MRIYRILPAHLRLALLCDLRVQSILDKVPFLKGCPSGTSIVGTIVRADVVLLLSSMMSHWHVCKG